MPSRLARMMRRLDSLPSEATPTLMGPATCRPTWRLPAIPCYRNDACNSLRKHKECRRKPKRPTVSRMHRTCCQRVRLPVMGHTHQSRQASACTVIQTTAAGQQTAETQHCWPHEAQHCDAAGAQGAGCSVTMLVFHAHAALSSWMLCKQPGLFMYSFEVQMHQAATCMPCAYCASTP